MYVKLYANTKNKKGSHFHETLICIVWEHTGSNRGPSACKADALNQLSYAPNIFLELLFTSFCKGSAKIRDQLF